MTSFTPEQLAILIAAMEADVARWQGFAQFAEESQDDLKRYEQGLQARNTLLLELHTRQTNIKG